MRIPKKILIVTIVAAGITVICSGGAKITGNQLIRKGSDHLIVQSSVEMADTNINSMLPGKIKEIAVKEGDMVKKGQVLISMDSDALYAQKAQIEAQIDSASAQVEVAQAAKKAADAKLEGLNNGARSEEISQAKAAYELTQKTYDRVKLLYDDGAVAQSDLDSASTQLSLSKDKYSMAKNGSRPEEIKAAQAQADQAAAAIQAADGQVRQAKAGLEAVMINLGYATIISPGDGVVTQLNAEVGELVSTGMPLAVITDTSYPWILCNVNETDLSKVEMNQEVSITLAAYKDQTFKGKVVRINKNADFAIKRATNDNGGFDILSYGVKVELVDLTQPLHAGMTAFVDFGK